jgi:Tfp pilus assembly ATPase PilU
MNIESYIERDGFKKLVLAQGNRPIIFLENGDLDYLSELVLDHDEIALALKALGFEEHLNSFSTESTFYKNGCEFLVKCLRFKDSLKVEVLRVEDLHSESLNSLNLPGYVTDWAQARKGLIFFYGPDYNVLDEVRLSFLQERASNVKGSTLIVRGHDPRLLGLKGHFFTVTQDESFLNEDEFKSLDFNAYMLSKDFHLYDPLKLLRLVEKGALILIQSPWTSLDKFLFSFNSWTSENKDLKRILLQETLGFVGARSITDIHKAKRPIFEVMPVEEDIENEKNLTAKSFGKTGLTFNQFLYSMLLKREISLKEAYSSSIDPEGLNSLLDESDSLNGR